MSERTPSEKRSHQRRTSASQRSDNYNQSPTQPKTPASGEPKKSTTTSQSVSEIEQSPLAKKSKTKPSPLSTEKVKVSPKGTSNSSVGEKKSYSLTPVLESEEARAPKSSEFKFSTGRGELLKCQDQSVVPDFTYRVLFAAPGQTRGKFKGVRSIHQLSGPLKRRLIDYAATHGGWKVKGVSSHCSVVIADKELPHTFCCCLPTNMSDHVDGERLKYAVVGFQKIPFETEILEAVRLELFTAIMDSMRPPDIQSGCYCEQSIDQGFVFVHFKIYPTVQVSAGNLACFLLAKFNVDDLSTKSLSRLLRRLIVRRNYSIQDGSSSPKNVPDGRQFRIRRIGLPAEAQVFTDNSGTSHTVQIFFKECRKIHLRYPELPVANIGRDDRPVWVPIECLELSEHSFVEVKKREAEHLKAQSDLSPNLENLRSLSLKSEKHKLDIHSHVLVKPKLSCDGRSRKSHPEGHNNGRFDVAKVHLTSHSFSFHVLELYNDESRSGARLKELELESKSFKLEQDLKRYLSGARRGQYGYMSVNCLPSTLQELEEKFSTPLSLSRDFLVVILPNQSRAVHHKVRYWLDCQMGIQSLCYVRDATETMFIPIQNLALKINAKLGGLNFAAEDITRHFSSTMVVGLSRREVNDRCRRCGGVTWVTSIVASNSATASSLPGSCRVHCVKEISSEAIHGQMIIERLKEWHDKNTGGMLLPSGILIYFSGLPKSFELDGLDYLKKYIRINSKKVVSGIDYSPSISLVAVERSPNAALYEADKKVGYKLVSTPGFTFEAPLKVDKTPFEFYLRSHYTGLGKGSTSNQEQGQSNKPSLDPDWEHTERCHFSHYTVLVDEIGYSKKPNDDSKARDIQEITHMLCWMSPHSNAAQSKPSPICLSQKLCRRVLEYIRALKAVEKDIPEKWEKNGEGPWHQRLNQTMFYI